MKSYVVAPLLAMLAGCPSDPDTNAPTLWLAPDGVETRVRLVESEPTRF
jgi:hypothetical protein